MYGQQSILKELLEDSNNQFYIFLGSKGKGKKTLASEFAKEIGYSYQQINEAKIEDIKNIISTAYKKSHRVLYCIDGNRKINRKLQNTLLKLTEEPPEDAIIILTTQDIENIIPTLRSRGRSIRLEDYTYKVLSKFTNDPYLLEICESPGQIKRFQKLDVKEVKEYTSKIVNSIHKISNLNTFRVYMHYEMVFKHADNFDLFINALLKAYRDVLMSDVTVIDEMLTIHNYKDNIYISGISYPKMFDILMLELRSVACQSRNC